MAAESGLDAATLVPSGPGGRVTKTDVLAAAAPPAAVAPISGARDAVALTPTSRSQPLVPQRPSGEREVRVRDTNVG